VLAVLDGELPPIVFDVKLFDLYRGSGVEEGKKSLAFRVLMQDTQKTLTDGEVDAAMQRVISILTTRLDAKLRS
jgi:phenylalanyl-tRNA synthetase beta chain